MPVQTPISQSLILQYEELPVCHLLHFVTRLSVSVSVRWSVMRRRCAARSVMPLKTFMVSGRRLVRHARMCYCLNSFLYSPLLFLPKVGHANFSPANTQFSKFMTLFVTL